MPLATSTVKQLPKVVCGRELIISEGRKWFGECNFVYSTFHDSPSLHIPNAVVFQDW